MFRVYGGAYEYSGEHIDLACAQVHARWLSKRYSLTGVYLEDTETGTTHLYLDGQDTGKRIPQA